MNLDDTPLRWRRRFLRLRQCLCAAGPPSTPTRDQRPEVAERIAWINARHPSTFSGSSCRAPWLLVCAVVADLRLPVSAFWIIEPSHRLVFRSLDMLQSYSSRNANIAGMITSHSLYAGYTSATANGQFITRPLISRFRETLIPLSDTNE